MSMNNRGLPKIWRRHGRTFKLHKQASFSSFPPPSPSAARWLRWVGSWSLRCRSSSLNWTKCTRSSHSSARTATESSTTLICSSTGRQRLKAFALSRRHFASTSPPSHRTFESPALAQAHALSLTPGVAAPPPPLPAAPLLTPPRPAVRDTRTPFRTFSTFRSQRSLAPSPCR